MISLTTAKAILQHANRLGIRVKRAPNWVFNFCEADGLASPWRPKTVWIRKGANFAAVIHEIGHAIDFRDRGFGWKIRRLISLKFRTSEIRANHFACKILGDLGTQDEVAYYRRGQVSAQRRIRAISKGHASRIAEFGSISTRFKLVTIGGRQRFMFIFDSPEQLKRCGGGQYHADPGVTLVAEWSKDGRRFVAGKFSDAPNPERKNPDGSWTYRAISSVSGGQFARLRIVA